MSCVWQCELRTPSRALTLMRAVPTSWIDEPSVFGGAVGRDWPAAWENWVDNWEDYRRKNGADKPKRHSPDDPFAGMA